MEMDFKEFKLAVQRQFNNMKSHGFFRVDVDKDALWERYLNSFPEGTNPMYKERTEHDCTCCRQFIRNVGDMVSIINGKVVSIWNVTIPSGSGYQVVTDALSAMIKSCEIGNVFLHTEPRAGMENNLQLLEDQSVKTWDHFCIQLPSELVVRGADIGSKLSDKRATKDVMYRGLSEITEEAIATVLEMIDQNSIYRGAEHKFAVTEFKKLKKEFTKSSDKNTFCWSMVNTVPTSVSRIRGTVIGTLLTDISEGVDLDSAVASFESKVAPANYKRPTAVITKAMIENARKTIGELGFSNSLNRRYATLEDISINNILFADRTAKPRMNDVFDELIQSAPNAPKNLDKVEEVSIEKFIKDILPQTTSLEIMFENHQAPNLFSLIAPADLTAKTMFKWDNGFSWSYNGDMADSIKERVKAAGGNVTGDVRCSLSWFNGDDLDLHMKEAGGSEIYYGSRSSFHTGGVLDVDMNAGGAHTRTPVENITYPDRKKMKEGIYQLVVHNFFKRESKDVGFTVEIEFDGVINTFNYDKAVGQGATVTVAKLSYSKKDGLKIVESLPSSKLPKLIWGINTNTFHKVNVMMLSPNYWDDKGVGNKHYFFALENCANDGTARGFFNEFLSADLDKHRKVFEMVGSKMQTDETKDQLSGLGFSSTQRTSVLCRVTGTFSRIVKVLF